MVRIVILFFVSILIAGSFPTSNGFPLCNQVTLGSGWPWRTPKSFTSAPSSAINPWTGVENLGAWSFLTISFLTISLLWVIVCEYEWNSFCCCCCTVCCCCCLGSLTVQLETHSPHSLTALTLKSPSKTGLNCLMIILRKILIYV